MIAIANRTKAATLFWRLSVLRRQLERARAETALLRTIAAACDDDLGDQLYEAGAFIGEAINYLTPAEEHVDCAVEPEEPERDAHPGS